MKRILLAALLSLIALPALAASQGFVVSSCPGTLGVNAYTAGQYGNITVDVNGLQCVAGSITITPSGTQNVNVTQWATTALAVPTAWGVAPSGNVIGANVNCVAGCMSSGADLCQNPSILKSSVPINITSAATTQLVAISGTTSIYVCHFSFTISEVITTANTLQFEYGTSTNCTGANKLTGLYGAGGVTVAAPVTVSAGYGGTLFTVPASNGLCALTAIGATGSFQGILTFVQQ
jgi:hypothetical protein